MSDQGTETHEIYQRWKSSLNQPTTTKENSKMTEERNEATYVNINDLGLADEPLGEGFDAGADAFSLPPPPPDGIYTVKLRHQELDAEKQWRKMKDKASHDYYATKLVAEIISGAYEGRILFDSLVSTMVMQSSGTSRVAGILSALGKYVEVREARTHVDLARLLSKALAADPQCQVKTRWEARYYDKQQEKETFKLSGMSKFPSDGKGGFKPIVEEPTNGEEVRAQATIVQYLPVAAAAPAINSPMSAGGFGRSA